MLKAQRARRASRSPSRAARPEPLLQLGDDCPAFAPAGIVVELARSGYEVPDEHELLAPSPIRSQTLLNLHEAVHRGELESEAAQELLERIWKLPIRLLNTVLRRPGVEACGGARPGIDLRRRVRRAARLQADVHVTPNEQLARSVVGPVESAPLDAPRA